MRIKAAEEKEKKQKKKSNKMVVFPKQICKRVLPERGESKSDKTFFLKADMELEVCTSLGSMFHRRGALLVKEIRPANDAGEMVESHPVVARGYHAASHEN